MGELWDIYDVNRKKTGRTAERDNYEFQDGEYHIVVVGLIMNENHEILVSKRAPHKVHGLQWELNGGSILAGETSLAGMIRELKEELGVVVTKEEAILLKSMKRDKVLPSFKDMWLFQKEIDIADLTFPDGEATEAKWVSMEVFMDMVEKDEMIPSIDFDWEDYQKAVEICNGNIEEKSCGCIVCGKSYGWRDEAARRGN